MLSQFLYPMIVSEHFEQTVAFYEDHFEFSPSLEMEGFVILSRDDCTDMYLAIFDYRHDVIPEKYRKPVSGMILNYPTKDAQAMYNRLYDDGLDLVSEPEEVKCGRKHFFVEDPNGILIDVAEDVDLAKVMSPEEFKDLCFVA